MVEKLGKISVQKKFFVQVLQSSWLIYFLAVFLAVFFGSLLIIFTSSEVSKTVEYFFSRPGDTFVAIWEVVSSAYSALFRGSVVDFSATNFTNFVKPFTETLTVATPLITAGLGVALAFKAGLFNIGAQGQIILGATMAAYAGFSWDLPVGLHLLVVVLFGVLGGAFWGAIVGVIKARTGAHEVILTIMLNYIAVNLLFYLLSTSFFQRPGSQNLISPVLHSNAIYPKIFGENFRVHLGLVVAILATIFVSWCLNRSVLGFKLRTVGVNSKAAKVAGINVGYIYVLVMVMVGALSGLSGVSQVSGTEKVLTSDVAASFGFDAITVALLGRSTPWGTFFAAILFGAFRSGGVAMQAQTDTPLDLVLVIQSLIVLFLAAPAVVRAIFRLRETKSSLGVVL